MTGISADRFDEDATIKQSIEAAIAGVMDGVVAEGVRITHVCPLTSRFWGINPGCNAYAEGKDVRLDRCLLRHGWVTNRVLKDMTEAQKRAAVIAEIAAATSLTAATLANLRRPSKPTAPVRSQPSG